MTKVILASASRGRLDTLRRAGIEPDVVVSGVDEDAIAADSPAELAAALAQAKGAAVAETIASSVLTVMIACDSLLELDGRACGKPGTPERAREQWRKMRGRIGLLHTGHHVIVREPGHPDRDDTRVATTLVEFADATDAEIDAYVTTGEPLGVAGGFTIDGYGGAFVTRVDGDPHNVVGLSLPLLRTMLSALGVPIHTLWQPGEAEAVR